MSLPHRIVVVVGVVLGLTACDESLAPFRRGSLDPRDCPADAAPGYTVEDAMAHRVRVKYVTEIIDGHISLWNWKVIEGQSLPVYDGPRMDELKNVSIPSNYLTWPQVARKYGTCLGVVVQVVTTKSGNWQPNPRLSSDH